MAEVDYKVTGMHCDGCAARLKKVLEAADGVRRAEASFDAGRSHIEFDMNKIGEEDLKAIIRKAGFDIAE